jgi:hypothetical protein
MRILIEKINIGLVGTLSESIKKILASNIGKRTKETCEKK